jgi:type I restriction enzyme, S subunit
MNEWKTYKLGEIVDITSSKRIFMADYVSSGIPFYRSKEVIERFKKNNVSTELFIEKSKFEEIKNKFGAPVENDILLTSVGTIGIPFKVQKNDEFYFKDGNLTWFRNYSNKIIPNFLYYWIQSSVGKDAIDKTKIGSTQQALTIASLKQIEIQLPNLATQTQIAQILTSLDDKIELNLQMNQTLEAMAQALFKEWFVNFNFPSSESEFTELNDLQDLNNKSSKSKNPENQGSDNLPKGWRMGKLGEILQPKRGKNITKAEAIEGVFPVVAGGLEPSCYHNESNTKEPVITISSSGANAGFVRLYQMPVWSADSCFIDGSIYPFVHYCYIFLKLNQKNIYDSQEGSAQPHIYPRHIMDLNICIGNDSVVQQFEEIVIPLFEKIKYNSLQIQTLTQTRDTLLPKLMSGKLEIKK